MEYTLFSYRLAIFWLLCVQTTKIVYNDEKKNI